MSERLSTQTALTLPGEIYDAIRKHGERTYPHECCGVLLGKSSDAGSAVEAAVEAGKQAYRDAVTDIKSASAGSGGRRTWCTRRARGSSRADVTGLHSRPQIPTRSKCMEDSEILGQIDKLVAEEQHLFEREGHGQLEPGDHERLQEIKDSLARCWDLPRPRRAAGRAGARDEHRCCSLREPTSAIP